MLKKPIRWPAAVLLVAALVFLVVWPDSPLRNRLQIYEYSGIMIKEMREVSEWIGAEYRGEVLMSLQEYEENQWLTACEIAWRQTTTKLDSSEMLRADSLKICLKLLQAATDFNNAEWQSYLTDNSWAAYNSVYGGRLFSLVTRKIKNELKDTDLVYIARGEVRAGFNFSEINRHQISVENDTLWIRDLNPQILHVTINPWFIPNKLKGHELVRIRNGDKISREQQDAVKKASAVKLRDRALQSGILEKAVETTEAQLMILSQTLFKNHGMREVVISGEKN